jgi:alkylation response protein AidB-like acyl-CoA dehydrogenase
MTDIVVPHPVKYGSEAQVQAWLPKMACGEVMTAFGG